MLAKIVKSAARAVGEVVAAPITVTNAAIKAVEREVAGKK